MAKLTPNEIENKFKEHLQFVDEVVLIVLKGHLLIEESLDSILQKFVFHQEFIESANLRFVQKVDLARSISLDDHENSMWKIPLAFNSLRNELAHSLTSDRRDQKVQQIVDLYFELTSDIPEFEVNKKEPNEVILYWTIAFFMGYLESFEAEVERFRKMVDAMDYAMNPHRHTKLDNA